MKIPDNYRKLKPDETIRENDLYIDLIDDHSGKAKYSIGYKVNRYNRFYNFYRRRHTAKKAPVVQHTPTSAAKRAKNVTVVSFGYPSSRHTGCMIHRLVQVISMDGKYLTGLEQNVDGKYQFKKFLRSRINDDRIQLVKYGSPVPPFPTKPKDYTDPAQVQDYERRLREFFHVS